MQRHLHKIQGTKTCWQWKICLWTETMPNLWNLHQMGRSMVSMLWLPLKDQTKKPEVQGKTTCTRRRKSCFAKYVKNNSYFYWLTLAIKSQNDLAKLERMKLVFKKILHEIFSNSHHKQRVLLGIFLMVISLQI